MQLPRIQSLDIPTIRFIFSSCLMFSLGGLPHLANSSTVQCPLTTFEMKAHHEFSCKASISSCTRKRIENEVIDIHEWEWRHE
jgi:hypothetical protein